MSKEEEQTGIKGDAHHDLVFGLPKYETIAFSDLRKKHRDGSRKFLEVLLLGYMPDTLLDEITAGDDWNAEKMRICITLNERVITQTTFESMCSEFSGRMAKQRLDNAKFDDFQAAVLAKAKELSQKVFDDFQNKTYELNQAMERLTESTTGMVEKVWEQERFDRQDRQELQKSIVALLNESAPGVENPYALAQSIMSHMGKPSD